MDDASAVRTVESHFGVRLRKCGSEYHSTNGCPVCGGHDRFMVFVDMSPRYWCRRCGLFGFVDAINGDRWKDLSWSEKRRRVMQGEKLRRQEEERERVLRQQALDEMRASGAADNYHEAMKLAPSALNYWFSEGFDADTIDHFRLGYCEACPLDYPDHRPSVTIPVYSKGALWNIRHRILGARTGDKYRPHAKHLPRVLFNADDLSADSDYILIVEGEKKSMAAWQVGWTNVGIMGQDSFDYNWIPRFSNFEWIYVVLDPDALDNAHAIAEAFGDRARAVRLPEKLDDMLNPYKRGIPPETIWKAIIGE